MDLCNFEPNDHVILSILWSFRWTKTFKMLNKHHCVRSNKNQSSCNFLIFNPPGLSKTQRKIIALIQNYIKISSGWWIIQYLLYWMQSFIKIPFSCTAKKLHVECVTHSHPFQGRVEAPAFSMKRYFAHHFPFGGRSICRYHCTVIIRSIV